MNMKSNNDKENTTNNIHKDISILFFFLFLVLFLNFDFLVITQLIFTFFSLQNLFRGNW